MKENCGKKYEFKVLQKVELKPVPAIKLNK